MSIPMWVRAKPAQQGAGTILGRITSDSTKRDGREDYCLLTEKLYLGAALEGWAAVLTTSEAGPESIQFFVDRNVPLFHSLARRDHLSDGDVIAADPTGMIRTLYRIDSPHNSILAAEACNSFCVMCSQPPRRIDDREWLNQHFRLLELVDRSTSALGITGGEPTLLKTDLLRLIRRCREILPETALHILTNGRLFYYGAFARDLAAIEHPEIMLGIPLYSDVDSIHDFVVQAEGAFDETLIGLQNLGRWRVPVEIRVVLHRYTYERLPQLAEFICRNLPFAAQVSLMGLEIMGFAIFNLKKIWIDPYDYRRELFDATRILANFGMNVSIFNHQLCVVPRELWPFCAKSISDWKNDYLPECCGCAMRQDCGGFFSSSLARSYSAHIAPIAESSGNVASVNRGS